MEHLYSGLETEGMKVLKCTLKIQPHWEYQHDILTLPQKRVTVPMDGSDAKNVMFHGCKVMQLALSGGRREGELVMPVSFTIGGPCTYNKEDKKDFEIMMRSKEQSLAMHIPPNGNFDWPDYRAFETCPGCCTRAKASSSGRRYWLLFQPVLQHVYASQNEGQATMAIRMLCRLTCQECLENMTEDKYVEVIQGNGDAAIVNVPLLDVIEEQGPITWLSDGQMRVRSINEDTCLNAYTLYQTWENVRLGVCWCFLSLCARTHTHCSSIYKRLVHGNPYQITLVRSCKVQWREQISSQHSSVQRTQAMETHGRWIRSPKRMGRCVMVQTARIYMVKELHQNQEKRREEEFVFRSVLDAS